MGVHEWTCAPALGSEPSHRDSEVAAAALAAVIPQVKAAALREAAGVLGHADWLTVDSVRRGLHRRADRIERGEL